MVLIELVDREDHHLLAVRQRLLGDDCTVDAGSLLRLVEDDARFDEGGQANRLMSRLLGHRQTKGAANR